MTPEANTKTRLFIHRRFAVRFLIMLLVLLTALSVLFLATGWGADTGSGREDSGTPTALSDTTPFYVLLIGSDSLKGTALYTGGVDKAPREPEQHADAITLARVDPEQFKITLVTVPANTVLYDGDEPVKESLSDGGPMQVVYTVERIAGVDIRNYFMLDYNDFEALVNEVGKVNADVPADIVMQDPVTAKTVRVKKGEDRKLNGAETLAFVRDASPYAGDQDAHRQLNVREVETDIIGQVLGFEDKKVRKVLGVFEQGCVSDMDNSDLISLVTRFYENREAVSVYSCTGPYLATGMGLEDEPIIRQPVAAWRELMTVVDSGQDPAEVLPQYTFSHDSDPAEGLPTEGEDDASAQGAPAADAPDAKI